MNVVNNSQADIPSFYFIREFLVGTLGRDSYVLDQKELLAVRTIFKAFSDIVFDTDYLILSK